MYYRFQKQSHLRQKSHKICHHFQFRLYQTKGIAYTYSNTSSWGSLVDIDATPPGGVDLYSDATPVGGVD